MKRNIISNKHYCVAILLVLMFFLSSCLKQERKNQIIEQQKSIDTYLLARKDTVVVRNNGSSRVIIKKGDEKKVLSDGDSLYYFFAGHIFSNGKGELFASNKGSIVKANKFPPDTLVIKSVLSRGDMISGLYYGLMGAAEGEKCNVVFAGDLAYYTQTVYNIPKLSPLFFQIWVDKVIKK